jgi:Flp pilus assembly protein CpaB
VLVITKKVKLIISLSISAIVICITGTMVRYEKSKTLHSTQMTTVLRARKYIATGKTISPEMVDEIRVPVLYAPPSVLSQKSELVNAQNQAKYKARIGLLKGEWIGKSVLTEESGALGFAWSLQPGETALSFRLNAEDAVAGHIQVGDFVNVMSVAQNQSHYLFPHARVAAMSDSSKSMASEPIIVTLALAPRDALLASAAAMKGKLTLTLVSALEGSEWRTK